MDKSLKLFSVSHRIENNLPQDRLLLAVGDHSSEIEADFFDNTGDNISFKNPNYCELTALYWIWKNVNCDYVGFEHYRRFFFTRGQLFARPLTKVEIKNILRSGKIIIPKPHKCHCSVSDDYAANHDINDLNLCGKIIEEKFPDYFSSFKKVLSGNQYSLGNMFVMPKSMLDSYCSWLFEILSTIESKIDVGSKDAYQSRVFGFLSERLFNVWLDKHNLNIYYAPVYNIGDCPIIVRIKGKMSQISKKQIR